jgi:hypothetical protein
MADRPETRFEDRRKTGACPEKKRKIRAECDA